MKATATLYIITDPHTGKVCAWDVTADALERTLDFLRSCGATALAYAEQAAA